MKSKYAKNKKSIDIGLEVAAIVTQGETELSRSDLADICECSEMSIYNIEKKALAKLKKAFEDYNWS